MPRIVSLWLPRWPILRFLAAQARQPQPCAADVDPERPFLLAAEAAGGPRVVAANAHAEALGIRVGDCVADARAKAGDLLQIRGADPAADRSALRRLALWATRYTPTVSPWEGRNGTDGFFLDVTGASHLLGGEKQLMADLAHRLDRFGFGARLALAGTPGAAWALSHFHSSQRMILETGQEATALAPLPIEGLRLEPDTCATLRRLGFKRIGALAGQPRAPFTARFSSELLRALDQALGRAPDPPTPIVPPPVYFSLRQLLEPIATQEAIVIAAGRLMEDLIPSLVRDGTGARALCLSLYRVDGAVQPLDIGLAAPSRDPGHIARLIDLKLARIVEEIDAGFGFEALALAVTVAERMEPAQRELVSGASDAGRTERAALLVDSLRQRLGPHSVKRLSPVASHLPERAERICADVAEPSSAGPTWAAADEARPRPILLLSRAEPADVVALVPEGLPRRFRWRGTTYAIARLEGPERIAGEWWRKRTSEPTRDYYLAEDEGGRRFWLYREGIYGRETELPPRWLVHGLFA